MNRDYFVVDFEFTQYSKPVGKPRGFFSEIVEIGAVKIAGDTNEAVGNIQDFVKPHFYPKQAGEIMEFCGITEAHMKTAIDFSAMLEKIGLLYVPGKTFFVTWGGEDYRVIKNGCERHQRTNPILPEDCLDLAEAYRLLNDDRNTTSLRNAAEELDIAEEGHLHAAYDDAVKTGKILIKLLADGWRPE